jgi:hypothetical protein
MLRRALVIGIALAAGCAPHSAGTASAPSTRSRNTLLADEMKTVDVATAYDAIARLRPSWLRSRGPISVQQPGAGQVVAYVDGLRVGGADALARVPASAVVQMEFLSGPDATTRFGVGHDGGAILVRTR